MSEWKKVKIADFLHRQKQQIKLNPEQEYALVTIRVKHKGVQLREMKKGGQIGSKMYQIKKGQFILSAIDARQGAFGIVPDELDGAIVTNDFWSFEVDEKVVKRDFFYWLTTTPLFLDSCIKSSKGETQRIRLQKDAFYNFEFNFPTVEKQAVFLTRLQIVDNNLSALALEQLNQQTYLIKLRQAILQEAIEGKLTADWRVNNPVCLGNPEYDAAALLNTIKTEKQKLIAEGKIKKEKPLAPINPDDVPFTLPDGWVWVRLGEVEKQHVDCPHATPTYLQSGMACLRASNITPAGITFAEKRYVSESEYSKRIERLKPEKYDLVYIREGGRLGIAGLINIDEPCCLGQRLMLMRFFENITARYCCYFINAPSTYQTALKTFSGAASPHINVRDVINNFFPLPPLAEQHAIVERVDRLLATVNALEQQVQARKTYAEQLMQAVLKEAFAA